MTEVRYLTTKEVLDYIIENTTEYVEHRKKCSHRREDSYQPLWHGVSLWWNHDHMIVSFDEGFGSLAVNYTKEEFKKRYAGYEWRLE